MSQNGSRLWINTGVFAFPEPSDLFTSICSVIVFFFLFKSAIGVKKKTKLNSKQN